ncbi:MULTISPECIES: monovalent cation/H(+) antiporter subunit G [unclassified Streptomyces]|uniref:monovalent cation/H(+) antiporter subunit G n=1 Tax=unclassified Streptomyces TaxID=2593676 RepID=UPI0022B66908|nr:MULTISPECIES: monovalent cation/H(+) antiporter subunit G [unclassified Streptomyces]MCZ7414336.1 monovalent cation/H(+) antiporter subunit G [Streptomyces sp. WMMC897]MCZ7431291.1 monovalent cation/H(+) antiporter subunit G [Streptomyces sp. WMMC1477]
MSAVLDVASVVLVLAGVLFCLFAAVGLLRFPDTSTRLHAAAKAQTVGVLLTLNAAAFQVPVGDVPTLLLVALFQFATVPVTAQIVGRTSYRVRELDRDRISRDELAGHPRERSAPDDGRSDGAGNGSPGVADDGPDDGPGNGRGVTGA